MEQVYEYGLADSGFDVQLPVDVDFIFHIHTQTNMLFLFFHEKSILTCNKWYCIGCECTRKDWIVYSSLYCSRSTTMSGSFLISRNNWSLSQKYLCKNSNYSSLKLSKSFGSNFWLSVCLCTLIWSIVFLTS
jgi:hypothetical protein